MRLCQSVLVCACSHACMCGQKQTKAEGEAPSCLRDNIQHADDGMLCVWQWRIQGWLDDWLKARTNVTVFTDKITFSCSKGKIIFHNYNNFILGLGFLAETLLSESADFLFSLRNCLFVQQSLKKWRVWFWVIMSDSAVTCIFLSFHLRLCSKVPHLPLASPTFTRARSTWCVFFLEILAPSSQVLVEICAVWKFSNCWLSTATKGRRLIDCENFSGQSFSLERSFPGNIVWTNEKLHL